MRYPSSKKSAKIENRADFSIFWLTLCEAGLNAAENKKIRDYFLIPHRSVVQDRDNSSSRKRKLRLKLILMIIPGMYKFLKKFWKSHQIITIWADENRSILDLYWKKSGESDLIQSILDFSHFQFSDFWITIFRKNKILKSRFSTFWPRLFYFSSSVRESSWNSATSMAWKKMSHLPPSCCKIGSKINTLSFSRMQNYRIFGFSENRKIKNLKIEISNV